MCERKTVCKPFNPYIKFKSMFKVWEPPIDEGKIWQDIVNNDIDMNKLYDAKKEEQYKKKFAQPEMISNYLETKIYPYLIPAFEHCCALALYKNAPENPKQIFNCIDAISEYLWNKNPRYPYRMNNWKSAYSIYKYKAYTKERPIYPLHWRITKDEAALMIQRFWRGYKVRKEPDVQELRKFWKQIKEENWKFKRFVTQPEPACPSRFPREKRFF